MNIGIHSRANGAEKNLIIYMVLKPYPANIV
jgi:hypothetical protein